MNGLARTFQVADRQWFYNAVDSRLYRVGPEGGELPVPTADVHFGCSEEHLRQQVARGPEALTLGITEQCNLRCRYCAFSGSYRNERTHNDRHMSEAVALRGVDQFLAMNAGRDRVSISFFGGEPLVAFDLVRRVVEHVEANHPHRRCRFGMTTNATKLKGDIAEFAIRHRFLLGVSLDGPQAVHDANRRFPGEQGSWDVVMRNLAALQTAAPEYYRTHIGFLAVLSDPRRMPQMHEFFSTEPLVCHNGLVVTPIRVFDADPAILPQLNQSEEAAYTDYMERLGQRFVDDVLSGCDPPDHFADAMLAGMVRSIHGRSMQPLEESQLPSATCVPAAEKLFLSASGTYHVCSNLAAAFPLGDVETGLDPEKGLALVREFLALNQADCANCWAVRLCHVCPLRARDGDRLSRERRREWCTMFLRQMERAFRIYIAVASRDREAWPRYFASRPQNPLEALLE
jgi:uncharacterized protein